MLLSDTPIDLERWEQSLGSPPGVEEEREGAALEKVCNGVGGEGAGPGRAHPLNVSALVDFVRTNHLPHSVIVDCSAADVATSDHASWLAKGVHVVSRMAFFRVGDGGSVVDSSIPEQCPVHFNHFRFRECPTVIIMWL